MCAKLKLKLNVEVMLELGIDGLRFDSLTVLMFVLSSNYNNFTKTLATQLVSMVTLRNQLYTTLPGLKGR